MSTPVVLTRARLGALSLSTRAQGVAVLVVATLAGIAYQWAILRSADHYHWDAAINLAWIRGYRDSSLFGDPMSRAMEETGFPPPIPDALYWLASRFMDPVVFAEWLGIALLAVSAWLLFRVVDAHTRWAPAGWLAVVLFLATQSLHRFAGGYPHSFAIPILLATVFLAVRGRHALAALVPVLGLVTYAPSAVVALLALAISVVSFRPLGFDPRRAAWVATSGAACLLLFVTGVVGGTEVLSREEAERLAEFGPSGPLPFFGVPFLDSLQNNFSGFDFQTGGSLIVVTALLLILVRPRNALLVRREIWALGAVSLLLFVVARATLFRLYVPHRYTYALLLVAIIVVAVALRPTFDALRRRVPSQVASAGLIAVGLAAVIGVTFLVFPLGPMESLSDFGTLMEGAWRYMVVGAIVGFLVASLFAVGRRGARLDVAAAVIGVGLLLGLVGWANGGKATARRCESPLLDYLATLPKDSIVAGDPFTMSCVPLGARRPVVISRRQFQPLFGRDYFYDTRARMFASIHALYGDEKEAILDLRRRYGADYFVVSRNVVRGRLRPNQEELRLGRFEPFESEIRRLQSSVGKPVSLRLPDGCLRWSGGLHRVYDLACLESEPGFST